MPDRPHPRKVSAGPASLASQNRCVALPVPPPAARDRQPESLPAASGMQAYEKIGVVNIDELANELNVKVASITQGFLKQQRGSSPAPAPAQPAQAPPAAVRTRRTTAAAGAALPQGSGGSFAYPAVANNSLQGGGRYMIDALDDILKASDLTAGGGAAAAAAEPSPPAAPDAERSAPVPGAAAADVPRLSSNPPGASRAESPASDFTFGSFDDRTEPPSMAAVVAAASAAAAAATTTTPNPRSGSGTYLDGSGDTGAAHRSDSFIEQEQARQRRAGANAPSNASLTLTVLRDGTPAEGSNGSGADAESDVSSIMSGPEEMFPSADDPSWIHIPQRDESPCCSSSEETGGHRGGGGGDAWATPQPSLTAGANTALTSFLDKEAVLPAGNILGNATFHMNAWFQSAIPRLPTTTTMCIVQDGSGAHYGNIQSTGGGDKRGSAGTATTVGPSALASVNAPPPAAGAGANNGGVTRMTRRLQLPTLPCEVKSVSIYRRPGDSYVSLTVVLSRPFLAWLALFIAFLLQGIETFVYVKELREPCRDTANATAPHAAHGGAALYGSADGVDSVFSEGVSVAELWVAELLAMLLIPLCLTAWCMGEFDGAGGGKYARTGHGLVFVLGFLVAFACYTVPFSKRTAQAGSITMLYPLPVLLMVLARLATTQRISFRAMAGVVLFTVGFIAGRGLPDSDTACGSTSWSWAVVTLGCFGLAACLALAKRVRPHFPLPLLLLTVALGGCLAQVYFAASSGLPAKTIFLGFTDRPAFIYEMVWLVALRGGALTSWLWSIMYLSPLTVAAPMVGQRIVALAALSIYQNKDDAPGLAGQLLPLIPTFLGIVVLCSIDLKDRQKKVKLNDRAASALAGGEGRRKGSVMTQQGRAPQASRSLATLHGSQAGESFASSTHVLSQEEGEQRRLLGSEQRARR